jgi:hypothetical protein
MENIISQINLFHQRIENEQYKNLYQDFIIFLNGVIIPNDFQQKIQSVKIQMILLLNQLTNEIRDIFKNEVLYEIIDMNSIKLGIPCLEGSDIDFGIRIQNKDNKKVETLISQIGYNFSRNDVRTNDKIYTKYIQNIEVELGIQCGTTPKIFSSYRFLNKLLCEEDKIKISYIKTNLKKIDQQLYYKFKYIIYNIGLVSFGYEKLSL